MSLTGQQFAELSEALRGAFNVASFDQLLASIGKNREDYIATAASLPDIIRLVLREAEASHWTHQLIEGAIRRNPGNPAVKNFVVVHPEHDPVKRVMAGHICDTPFVQAQKAFLARRQLRDHLKVMGNGANFRVVVINGNRCTGKTYSRELIAYVAERSVHERVEYVDLDKGIYDVEMLAESIGRRMNLDLSTMPARRGEQDARWVPELVAWLVAAARNGHHIWWLILDGFRVQVLPDATIDLIHSLVESVIVNAPQLRIVLINYDKLPPSLDYSARKELIEPVRKEDVKLFLAQACSHLGVTRSEHEVSTAADEVWRQVKDQIDKQPEKSNQWLFLLNVASKEAALRLANS